MYHTIMIRTVAAMVSGAARSESRDLVRGVSIDSKMTMPGDIFFALKGEHTDGHHYVPEALQNGAVAAVVAKSSGKKEEIVVTDTLFALGEFARKYRNMFNVKTIAITGTNGKTTVKNIISAVLGMEHDVLRAKKNYNSLIGLPLTLLDITGDEEYLIVEMGTSSPGEIARLCDIARPDIGIITTVGPGHLLNLGSIDGVKKEKLALIDALPDNGFGIVGAGVDAPRPNVEKIGPHMLSDIRLTEYGSHFVFDGHVFFTPLLGSGNVMNSLIAICVCRKLGITYDIQRAALEEIRPEGGRMEPMYRDGLLLINDTYNANPASMKMAIDFVETLERRKVFILGDMMELGESSVSMHKDIGGYARDRCDLLLTSGDQSKYYGGKHFIDDQDIINYLVANLYGDEAILIKASRSLRFEKIVQELLRRL
jgi:UDP-N-acetylmuramoyl-tripeptide--D-alanyl-D-alanine ligase